VLGTFTFEFFFHLCFAGAGLFSQGVALGFFALVLFFLALDTLLLEPLLLLAAHLSLLVAAQLLLLLALTHPVQPTLLLPLLFTLLQGSLEI
jgi:hypothetical protein